jgi:hypothetical protein
VFEGCGGSDSGSGGNSSQGDAPQVDAPEHEIVNEQEFEQDGFAGKNFTISTGATSEEDFRLITESVQQDNPNLDAISIGFVGEDGVEQTGGAQYFASREAAEAILGNGYAESDIDMIMNEDDGYLVASLGDVMDEMCAESDAEMRSIMECPPE